MTDKNIYDAILFLRPQLIQTIDYTVKNGVITWNNKESKKPTQSEIEKSLIEFEKEIKIKEESIQKSKDINTIFGEEDKLEAVIKQINLIAEVLDTITSDNPDLSIISDAKEKFASIKEILKKY